MAVCLGRALLSRRRQHPICCGVAAKVAARARGSWVRPRVLAGHGGSRWGDAGGPRPRRWCCRKSGRPHPSSLLSAALAECGTGGFPRVRRSPCRSAPKALASCPGESGAGTAAIQVAGAHLQLRGTRLGGGRFGLGSFFPEEVSLPALELAVETRLPWDSEDPPASASRAARLKAGVATPSLFVCFSRPSPVITMPKMNGAFYAVTPFWWSGQLSKPRGPVVTCLLSLPLLDPALSKHPRAPCSPLRKCSPLRGSKLLSRCF